MGKTVKKREHLYTAGGYKLVQPQWKTVWRFPQNYKYDPAIPLLGIYPKKSKILIQKDTSFPLFITILFTIAKIWKQPKFPSTDE